MKKRVLALLCAATMVLGASMSVCAAGSITAEEAKDQATEAVKELPKDPDNAVHTSVKKDGTIEVQISSAYVEGTPEVKPVNQENLKAAAESVAVDGKVAVVKELPMTDETVKAVTKLANEIGKEVWNILGDTNGGTVAIKSEIVPLDLDRAPGSSSKDEWVTVTLNRSLADNEQVIFSHQKADGTLEILTTRVVNGAEGKVNVNIKSFSPVAYMIVEVNEKVEDSGSGDSNTQPEKQTGTTAPTSPKTGDVFAAVILLAAVSGTASAAFGKKANKN